MLLQNFLNLLEGESVSSQAISNSRSIYGTILGYVRMIGTGAALIMLTFIALFYLTAESPEKAKVKERLINYSIGVVVFIGASNLVYFAEQLIEDIVKDIF